MKGAHLSLASLAPLLRRPCLDLRLYVLLVSLADSTGRVGTPSSPISLRRLAALLVAPGGHGQPAEAPAFQAIGRSLARLATRKPLFLSVVKAGRRGSIFQLEMGRGEIRLLDPAGHSAGHSRAPETRANGRSAHLSTVQPDGQPDASINTIFFTENAREVPVDKAAGREKLRAALPGAFK